jgi:hypothetical protein
VTGARTLAVVVAAVLTVPWAAPATVVRGVPAAEAAVTVAVPDADAPSDSDAVALLDRAIAAASEVPLRGQMTVASFGRGGPQVTTVDVARRADGRLRATRSGAWELGRDDDGSYLRSPRTGTLLEIGGIERQGFDRARFLAGYRVRDGGTTQLDTGPARTLLVTGRFDGTDREVLHVDDATGLIVRRETLTGAGQPVRVVAYTHLEVDDEVRARPDRDADGLDVETVALDPIERRTLEERGFVAAASLPGGFDLIDAAEVRDVEVPTVHLVYSDGLYTLSLYVQIGRLATRATRDAIPLQLPGGGTVWRWPGSEPRRVVWGGSGQTFTALTDAPTTDLLAAVASLPNDPAPSTIARMARGLSRVTDRLLPPWG